MPYEYRIAFARTWLALCSAAKERVAAAAVAKTVEENKSLALEAGESAEVGTENSGAEQDGEVNGDGSERQVPTVIYSRDSGLADSIRKIGIDGKLGSQICAHLEYTISIKKEMQACVKEVLVLFVLSYIATRELPARHIALPASPWFKEFEHAKDLRRDLHDAFNTTFGDPPDNYLCLALVSPGKKGQLGKDLLQNDIFTLKDGKRMAHSLLLQKHAHFFC
jgi:hypothetical protein